MTVLRIIILTLLLLTTGLQTYSQVARLRGHIKDTTGNGLIKDAQLKFLKNDTTITSGFNGNYTIDLTNYLFDTIIITHWKYGTTKVSFSLADKTVKELDIQLPVACKSFAITDICPKCKSNKNVIKIIYGYPTEETAKRADKGELRLGGCIINYCYPNYYCRKDDLEF
jgi:hypothetical protein